MDSEDAVKAYAEIAHLGEQMLVAPDRLLADIQHLLGRQAGIEEDVLEGPVGEEKSAISKLQTFEISIDHGEVYVNV